MAYGGGPDSAHLTTTTPPPPCVKVIHHTKFAEAVKIRAKDDLAATIVVSLHNYQCRLEIFLRLFVCPAEQKCAKVPHPHFVFWRRFAEHREKIRTTVCMK